MFQMHARGWDTDPTLVSPVLQAGVPTPEPEGGQKHRELFQFQFFVVALALPHRHDKLWDIAWEGIPAAKAWESSVASRQDF